MSDNKYDPNRKPQEQDRQNQRPGQGGQEQRPGQGTDKSGQMDKNKTKQEQGSKSDAWKSNPGSKTTK